MDQKSPDAFRTISEVAEWLGVPTHVLRFWESRFTQVKPVKRAGGRRYYRPADMELLGGIRKLLHEDGLTIRGVQKLLREEGIKHVASMSPPLDFHAGDAGVAASLDPATEAPEDQDTVEEVDADSILSPVEDADLPSTPDMGFDSVAEADQPDEAPDASEFDLSFEPDAADDDDTAHEDTTIDEAPPAPFDLDTAPADSQAEEDEDLADAGVVTSGLLPDEDEEPTAEPPDGDATRAAVTSLFGAADDRDAALAEAEVAPDFTAGMTDHEDEAPYMDAPEPDAATAWDDAETPASETEPETEPEPEPEPETDPDMFDGPILVMPDIPDDPVDGALAPLIGPLGPRLRALNARSHPIQPAAFRALADQLQVLADEVGRPPSR